MVVDLSIFRVELWVDLHREDYSYEFYCTVCKLREPFVVENQESIVTLEELVQKAIKHKHQILGPV